MLLSLRGAALALLLTTAFAHAVDAPIEADAFVRGGAKSSANFGASSTLWVRQSGPRYSLVRFDMSGLSGTPTSATLTLRLLGLNSPGTFDVHRLLAPWDEGAVTFDMSPAFDPMVAGTLELSAGDANSNISVDVLPAVTAWLAGEPNHGFIVVPVDSVNAKFSSREGSVAPTLDVELQPTPPQSATVANVGGDYTSPIAAMANAVEGDAWCGTPSATNPCQLLIGPGVFDLGEQTLTMQSHVSIRGAGAKATTLTALATQGPIVTAASHTTLEAIRFETDEDGSQPAVLLEDVQATDVVAVAVHARATGIMVSGSSDGVRLRDSDLLIDGTASGDQIAIVFDDQARGRMEGVSIVVAPSTGGSRGSCLQTMMFADVAVDELLCEAFAPLPVDLVAINMLQDSRLALIDSHVAADGVSSTTAIRTLHNGGGVSALAIVNSRVIATGDSSFGIWAFGPGGVADLPMHFVVRQSEIKGFRNAVLMQIGATADLANSQLIGGVGNSTNAATCLGSYDENLNPLGTDCQ